MDDAMHPVVGTASPGAGKLWGVMKGILVDRGSLVVAMNALALKFATVVTGYLQDVVLVMTALIGLLTVIEKVRGLRRGDGSGSGCRKCEKKGKDKNAS